MDNYEETEDLLSPGSDGEYYYQNPNPNWNSNLNPDDNKRKTTILTVVLIAVALAAVLGFFGFRRVRYRKEIEQAAAYQDAGQTNKAIKAYKNAAALNRREAYPYVQIGEIYLSRDQFDQAIKYLKLANDREESSETYTALGDAYTGKGDNQKAAAAYKKADTETNQDQNQKEKAGNSSANVEFSFNDGCISGSSVAKSGKWLFYSAYQGTYRTSGGKPKKIQDDSGYFLNAYNGWLYYECDYNDGGFCIERTRTDGSKTQTIYENKNDSVGVYWMKVYNGKIYCLEADSDLGDNLKGGWLISMSLDGGHEKTVIDSDVYYNSVSIDQGRIYYIDTSSRQYVSTNLNGEDSENVLDFSDSAYDESSSMPRVVYTDQNHVFYWMDKSLHVLDLKTDKTIDIKQPENTVGYEQINHDENGKYYYLLSNDERGKTATYSEWRMDTDGSNYKKLYTFRSTKVPYQYAYGNKICVNYYLDGRERVDVIDANKGSSQNYIDLPLDN